MKTTSTTRPGIGRRVPLIAALALVVVAGAGAGWTYGKRAPSSGSRADAVSTQDDHAATATEPTAAPPPVAADDRATRTDAPNRADARPTQTHLGNGAWPAAEGLARDPELVRFLTLRSKSVRTDTEERTYRALLADPTRVAAAGRSLSVVRGRTLDAAGQLERMSQIDYLAAALAWRENPRRAAVVDAVVAIVKEDNIDESQSEDLRRSIMADKMELARALARTDPAAAKELARSTEGSAIGSVVAFGARSGTMAPAARSAGASD